MKTIEEFRQFCLNDLRETLTDLEHHRKRVYKKFLFLIPMVLVALATGAIFTPIAIIPVAVMIALYFWLGPYNDHSAYEKSFKEKLIRSIVKFIDETLIYKPNHCIKDQTFNHSRIFIGGYDNYSGDDYVRGKIGKTTLEFSDLNVTKEQSTVKNSRTVTIFKGLFFIGDFHKNFKGETYVLTDKAESFFGKLGNKLQSLNMNRPPLVQLEDSEFEKNFVVHSTDQVEARFILSPSLMERILQLKARTRSNIQMSFRSSKIFLAIPSIKDFLEPSITESLFKTGNLEAYFIDLTMALAVVEDLSLNRRIWGKE